MKHFFVVLLAVWSIASLSGCSGKKPMLSGNVNHYKLSDFEETIYHEVDRNSVDDVEIYSKKLSFKEIDNKSYESMMKVGMQMFVDKHHSIVLKSGEHTIKYYYDVYFIRSATINFEQGHKYVFDADVTMVSQYKRKIKVWVYDLTDKKVVWGTKPDYIKYK